MTNGIFTMTGGSITGNVVKSGRGGGVYRYPANPSRGATTLGGTAQITGNKSGDDTIDDNLYLSNNKLVTLGTGTGEGGNNVAVPSSMSVGVTLQNGTGKFTDETATKAEDVRYFNSDAGLSMFYRGDGTIWLLNDWGALGNELAATTPQTMTKVLESTTELPFEVTPATEVAPAKITLKENFTAVDGDKTLTVNGEKTLDLNGFVLNANSVSTVGSVITVPSGAELTITDSSTGKYTYFNYVKDGKWTLNTTATPEAKAAATALDGIDSTTQNNALIKVTGGAITGGTGTKDITNTYGGGVLLKEGGSLTMTAGNVVGNTASNGGGVSVERDSEARTSAFNMTGGVIAGNTAQGNVDAGKGGGVYDALKFNMSGTALITQNTAAKGGGVHVAGSASSIGYTSYAAFNMTGGSITGNTATSEGGGVCIDDGSKVAITGGSITGNTATSEGGGVYDNSGLTLGGTAQITGNKNGAGDSAADSNLYLYNNITVTLGTGDGQEGNGAAVPADGMNVGVSTYTAPAKDSPVAITAANETDYSAYFFPDAGKLTQDVFYKGGESGDKKLYLSVPTITVTKTGTNPTYGTAMSADEDFFTVADTGFGTAPTLKLEWKSVDGENKVTWSTTAPTGVTASLADKKISIATLATLDAGGYVFRITNSQAEQIEDSASTTEPKAQIDNPMFVSSGEITLTVEQKEVTLNWTAPGDLVYSGTPKSPTVTAGNLANDDECTVTAEVTTADTNVNVGSFTFTATELSNSNYKLPSGVTSGTYTITEYSTTLTNVSTKLNYTGEKQTITFTPTYPEGATGNAALTQGDFTVKYYKVDEDYGTVVNATSLDGITSIGRYIYVATLKGDKTNYTFGSNTFDGTTITTSTTEAAVNGKVNAGVVAIGVEVPTMQKPISFQTGLINKLTTDTTAENTLTNDNANATTTYTSSNTAVATVADDGTVTIVAAGSTTITATSHIDGMTDVYAAYTLNVSKKEITVTVSDQTIKYGAASPYDAVADLTFSETPASGTDTTPTFSTSYVPGKSVNEYTVRVTLPVSDKYSYVYVPGTLTVEPKPLTVADFDVTATNKTYDGSTTATVTATVKSTSLVNSDAITVTAVGSFADANVGTGKTVSYKITGISGAKAGNYVLGTVEGTTTANITKATISFAFGENTFTYDGNRKAVSVTASGGNYTSVKYKGTDSTSYEESTTAPIHAGTYTVTAEYDTNSYTLSGSNTTTLTINPANVTVWTTGGTTHAYADADKSVSVMSIPNLALDVTYYSVGTGDVVGSSAESGVPTAVGKYLYVITLTNNEKNKDYKIGDALSGAPTGKALNALVGSNFGVMTIGNSAQKALSFNDAQVSKLTTDSAFTNTLSNPNTGATTTYSSSNTGVATVDGNGQVTIVGAGNAVITAKSELTGYTDAYASYTLNVAKQEITVKVNDQSVTYGGTSPYTDGNKSGITFGEAVADSDVTVTGLKYSGYTKGKSVGEYTVRASGLASDKYSFVYEPGTLTVNPKELNVGDFTVTAANKVYDGNNSATVTATVKSGSLAVNTDILTVTATGSFVDANVGTGKTVNFEITGISGAKASNYVLAASQQMKGTAQADITKMPVTFSFGTSEFAYDDNRKTVAVSAVDKDNRVFTNYTVKYTGTGDTIYAESETAPTNVGTYTVTAVYDTDTYEATSSTATLTITRGDAVVWASGGTEHLFNDANKTITAMSAPSLNLTVTYYTVAEDGAIGESVTPDELGRYLYVITLADDDETNKNYTIGGALVGSPTGNKVSELTASNIGIMTIDNSVQPELGTEQRVVTKTYGDAPFKVQVTGGEDGATINYSIPNEADREIASVNATTGEITIKKPGLIVVKATASMTGFTDAVTYFTVIIEKKLVNIVLEDEIVYAGKTITAPYTVTNDVEGNRITAEDIQFFYQSRTDETNHDFRNVDAYFVTAEIPSSNEYYRSNGAVFHLINITKAPLTVTVDNKTVTYGNAAPTYTVSYTGLGTDGNAFLSGTAAYTCTYAQYSDAGTYDISVAGLTSPNYDITFVKGTLTVNAKPVTLNWSDSSFTYDGQEHSVTATVANAVNNDTVNVITYTDNEKTAAGSYTAEATALSNANYTLTGGTDVSKTWSIAQKPVTVKPANVSVYVNGTAEPKLDVSALLAADRSYTGTPAFTLTDKDSNPIALTDAVKTAGAYTITWSNPDDISFNANYDVIKTTTATLTVSRYSGGGGGTVAAPTITIPVSGNTNSVEVSAKISGSTAAVQEIEDAELKKVVGGKTVEIDLTGLDKTIDTAQIPNATVGKIAEKSGMSVKLTTATVTFDKPATQEIFTQAKGNAIELVVEGVKAATLNTAQKDAIEKLNTVIIVDAYLSSNGTKLCTQSKGGFGSGKATVMLPYTLKTGSNASQYSVYYVADDGSLEKLNASYDVTARSFIFEIEHFSNYVVSYNGEGGSGYAACLKDVTCPISKFTDTKADFWWHDGIHYCLDNGLMNGVADTQFAPNGTITRGMIVTMLWRLDGQKYPNYYMTFKDVPASEWYTEAVRWAASEKIVSGYDAEHFGANDPVTREQLATILYNYAKYKGQGFTGDWMFLLNFVDRASISSWADEAVHWCSMKGIVTGKDGKVFDPQGYATRAEAASMMQRFCEAMDK